MENDNRLYCPLLLSSQAITNPDGWICRKKKKKKKLCVVGRR